MRAIPAKPVSVNGIHFRSMTEARFAVAMSALGLAWKYEPGLIKVGESIVGKALWYMPDFVLPEMHLHVEVKPSADVLLDNVDELIKPGMLAFWPMPVLVWLWDDETGFYSDVGRGIYLTNVSFQRCPECNLIVLVGLDYRLEMAFSRGVHSYDYTDPDLTPMLGPGFDLAPHKRASVNHTCGLPGADPSPWNRAVAIARGWRADA